MYSSITLKQHAYIQQQIEYFTSLACNAFKRNFSIPKWSLKQRGKIAGKALLQLNEIRLNPTLLLQNEQAFYEQVIPHEIAHLIVYQVFGRVRPHGKEWQQVMLQVFNCPATTTHQFDVSSVIGQTFTYRCHCDQHQLTIRRHNKILQGKANYQCKKCNTTLQFVD